MDRGRASGCAVPRAARPDRLRRTMRTDAPPPDAPFGTPTVVTRGDAAAPLVVLLHGRGSRETDIIDLAEALPPELGYAAVRAPLAEGPGFAWFANRGIGRPVPESLRATMD